MAGGEGSGPLLTLLANAYLQPGDEVIFSRHAFLIYEIITLANSAKPVIVPERTTNSGIKMDVDAMLAAVTPTHAHRLSANPNNPTGTYLSRDEMRRLHAGLPSNALLVIDAAYSEYVRRQRLRRGHRIGVQVRQCGDDAHLLQDSTGWRDQAGLGLCAPGDLRCDQSHPRAVQHLGLATGGGCGGDCGPGACRGVRRLQCQMAQLADEQIRKTGLRVDDSVANFVLMHFKDEKTAIAADAFLMKNGVILRGVEAYGLPDCLRLTIGTEEANRAAVAALTDFMAA